MLQVQQVAQSLGINPQTIYFYERIGLIPSPPRSPAGYRLFQPQDVERLALIGRAKTLGLTLEEIREILTLQADQSLTCQEIHDRLLAKVQKIDATIAQLQALKAELLPLVHRCEDIVSAQRPDAECGVLSLPPPPQPGEARAPCG
ncbi:MerR family DNA-binding protein [Synechococcales cyanobacterium C]|uniref:MerR family DNA-binding protein n=2 Tax=Petrachloros TaxID=2918834 RepID=A0A8K2AC28_9CYAN|nr:heavy metal-responsive transcriptional regulator [Petrachloros mirabilis]NCJ05553.1 MerR family DNA-binding protein [Petrachloros mirabilis ULC683]